MSSTFRRAAVVTAFGTAIALGAVSTLHASASAASMTGPSGMSVPATTVTGHASDLPSYDTWVSDVTAVTDQASAYLKTRLPAPSIKAAIVLDIDNTALETAYGGGTSTPATKPVLALAQQAHDAGAAVIFVTARPEILRGATEDNLEEVPYPNDGLHMRGFLKFSDKQTLKTNARTAIEQAGYTIVANIGNNDTDVDGGHAERTFRLPDYNGQLS